ncbi:hypothetical protein ABZ920_25305 [Streptomyces sp. NPDC046831]|uniref:hypothetical protein n=1 Tax=Streptomyces sp. NPDC046831 TaxID=3154805 RepID=UPI0033CE9BF1
MWRTPLADEGEGHRRRTTPAPSTTGETMFEYELQQMRAAELRRRADYERLVREAVRGRRAAARRDPEARTPGRPARRHRFTRAA